MGQRWKLLVGMAVLVGCAEVPMADELELDDDIELELELRYQSIPESVGALPPASPLPAAEALVPVAPYAGAPRISVSRYHAAEEGEGGATAQCPFEVEAEGFPAISDDGSKLAYWVAETLSSSDGEDELDTLRIVDTRTEQDETTLVVVDGSEGYGRRDHCRVLWRSAKRLASAANLQLATTRWRTMQHLPIEIHYPDHEHDRDEGLVPELVLQHDEAIVRIPGVKVLSRTRAAWDAAGDEGCAGFTATPESVYGDRDSGLLVVEVGQSAMPCYCYAETLYHPIEVPDEIFDLVGATTIAHDDDA